MSRAAKSYARGAYEAQNGGEGLYGAEVAIAKKLYSQLSDLQGSLV